MLAEAAARDSPSESVETVVGAGRDSDGDGMVVVGDVEDEGRRMMGVMGDSASA